MQHIILYILIGGYMGNFNNYIMNDKEEEKINADKIDKENLEDMINSYQGLSENELLNEFLKRTIDKKKKGELKKDELELIKSTIIPYLNEEQKINLDKLLRMVENV
jgi:hypothetical protein